MGLMIDLHIHTKRYSACSVLDPERLIARAIEVGLDGLVLTEHHHQWTEDELAKLRESAQDPGFILLAGFEYTSTMGDILVYGLEAPHVADLTPNMEPGQAVELFNSKGAVCIAAHPTRAGISFDERLLSLPLVAIEACSVNLQPHEQSLAFNLAKNINMRTISASDAHRLQDVGRYATEFSVRVRSMTNLIAALQNGKFRPVNSPVSVAHPAPIEKAPRT